MGIDRTVISGAGCIESVSVSVSGRKCQRVYWMCVGWVVPRKAGKLAPNMVTGTKRQNWPSKAPWLVPGDEWRGGEGRRGGERAVG